MTCDEATLDALEWSAVCALVARHTNAQPAREALAAARPLDDVEAAREALEETAEAMQLLSDEEPVPPPYVVDQARSLGALAVENAVLDGSALVSAARTLEGARRLASFLRRASGAAPRLAARFASAPRLPELERRLIDAFDPDHRLVDGASRELARLRGQVRSRRAELIELLDGMIARLPHTLTPADSRPTVREGRYVVPLRREALGDVPGIVHDESTSGATVFLEPHEAVDANNGLRRSELAVRREEDRVLRELTAALAERRGELEHAARLALHAEVALARARYALAAGGRSPELGGETLHLVEARHPLLAERETSGEIGRVVPLSLRLGPEERTLVVTGPNTGGKTVLLKTVGVCAVMAQAGIVPPVGEGTALPWHARIVADIGDTQSIAQDLSTFTAHLTRLRAATVAAGPATLVLVDEIGASTDPAEGAALAGALLEAWTERGARTVVTTHYHALKALATVVPGLVNGSLAYDIERNRPQYRFVQGVPGRSFGLELAERWGFGAEILASARARLEAGVGRLEDVVDRLSAAERGHAEAREALEAERHAIGAAESARARKAAAEAAAGRDAAERRLEALEAQLDRLREEARRQQRKLEERAVQLAEAQAEAEAARVLREEAESAAAALRAERESLARTRPAPRLGIGDRVRIPRYQVEGDVVEVDRAADGAVVRAGQVRITCRASECEVLETSDERDSRRTAAGRAAEGGDGPPPGHEPGDTAPVEIDLRGLTADEVGFPVADALERAYHTGRRRIRFIHGKGTGVLRRRVAEILDKHPYVREYRVGHWNEGGDGVTIASLVLEEGSEP